MADSKDYGFVHTNQMIFCENWYVEKDLNIWLWIFVLHAVSLARYWAIKIILWKLQLEPFQPTFTSLLPIAEKELYRRIEFKG